MADLVMTVERAAARRSGKKIVVDVSGESANSRDKVYAETARSGDSADVYVRVQSAGGFGTEMTGPFKVSASIDDGDGVQNVRVHGQNGVKTIRVS